MPTRKTIFTIAGVIAAIALAVRGLLDLREGAGWALLLVAAVIVLAIVARHTVFRD